MWGLGKKQEPEGVSGGDLVNESITPTSAGTIAMGRQFGSSKYTQNFILEMLTEKAFRYAPQDPVTAVESTETVIGYRTYSLLGSMLAGARKSWETNTLQAVCDSSNYIAAGNPFANRIVSPAENLKARQRCLDHMASSDAYREGHHGDFTNTIMGCGIYAMKDRAKVDRGYSEEYNCAALGGKQYTLDGPVEVGLYLARVSVEAETVLYGTVHDCEYGYRATDAKIERLWIMMPREKCGSCGGNLTIAGEYWHCPNVDGVNYTDVAELVDALKERYQVPVEIGVYRG